MVGGLKVLSKIRPKPKKVQGHFHSIAIWGFPFKNRPRQKCPGLDCFLKESKRGLLGLLVLLPLIVGFGFGLGFLGGPFAFLLFAASTFLISSAVLAPFFGASAPQPIIRTEEKAAKAKIDAVFMGGELLDNQNPGPRKLRNTFPTPESF